MSYHWFMQWPGAEQPTSYYVNQCSPSSLTRACGTSKRWVNAMVPIGWSCVLKIPERSPHKNAKDISLLGPFSMITPLSFRIWEEMGDWKLIPIHTRAQIQLHVFKHIWSDFYSNQILNGTTHQIMGMLIPHILEHIATYDTASNRKRRQHWLPRRRRWYSTLPATKGLQQLFCPVP